MIFDQPIFRQTNLLSGLRSDSGGNLQSLTSSEIGKKASLGAFSLGTFVALFGDSITKVAL